VDNISSLKKLVAETLPEQSVNTGLELVNTEEALLQWLEIRLNDLILHHFETLLFLLYRIDIDEAQVRKMLSTRAQENAGRILAELILKRQKEKLAWREKLKGYGTDGDENERW
jgi:hypothetical protein